MSNIRYAIEPTFIGLGALILYNKMFPNLFAFLMTAGDACVLALEVLFTTQSCWGYKKKSWPNSKAIKRESTREDGGCFNSSSMKEMPEGISEDSDFKVSVPP